MDEERMNQLLNAFNSMDDAVKGKLTEKYKITMALIGGQIERIEKARKDTKKFERRKNKIIKQLLSESNNAIEFEPERREQQRQQLTDKKKEWEEAKARENSETVEATDEIKRYIENLKASLKRQKNEIIDENNKKIQEIKASFPPDLERLDEESIKYYYNEKIYKSDDTAEIQELEKNKKNALAKLSRMKKISAEKDLTELNEQEKAVSELEKYIEKEINIDLTNQQGQQQQGPEQPEPEQPAPEQPAPEQPATKQPAPEKKPDKILTNAELLKKAQIESMTQENDYVEQPYIPQPTPVGKATPKQPAPKQPAPQQTGSQQQGQQQQTGKKITEFDILRTPKGIWIGDKIFIENRRIAKLEEQDLPEEIKHSVEEGKLGAFQDTKILKALTIYAKENKDVDLKGIMDNYADLVAKGKQDSDKSKIGYDIRAGISYLRPSVRKEIKEMKKLALSTKQYTSFYGNAISRRIFERKSIKQDKKLLQNKKVIGLNPGEQKAKSDIINGLNNNIKQQMQENQKNNFQNEIKYRTKTPYEAKQQEDINKAVKEMQNKALADEIKKAVDRKIEEEDKGDL